MVENESKPIYGDEHWVLNWRKITVCTPDTYLRPMQVVSTIMAKQDDGTWKGETAIANAKALNNLSIDFVNLAYTMIKKHTSQAEANEFHEKTAKEIDFAKVKPID